MTYISCLGGSTLELHAFAQGETYVMDVKVGRKPLENISYRLILKLHPSEEGTEFIFAFVTVDHNTGKFVPTFDSNEVATIVPKMYRKRNMAVLLEMAERLIRATNRESFYMVTFLPHLSEKQLQKYVKLCKVFETCGYSVTHTLPVPGKHFWRMTRVPPISTTQPSE